MNYTATLEKGDMSANEIYCRLDNEGVSKRVARMVKTEMGIHCYQKKRRWYWSVGYQSSTVLDEPEREAGTTSIPIPQREESENIPSPDLPEQLENVQQSGNEIAERGMQT